MTGELVLSLTEWPKKPLNTTVTIRLSPVTKALLKGAHVRVSDLLPMTYEQFLQGRREDS